MMSSAARRARRVLTVSQASKDDILHFLKIPAEKVEVIYNALDERLATAPTPDDVARVRSASSSRRRSCSTPATSSRTRTSTG